MSGRRKPKAPKIRYFFYDGDLNLKISTNRGADLLFAWNYTKGKMMPYSYTSVRKYGEKAFSTTQVAKMVGRNPYVVKRAIKEGWIEPPQMTYGIDENRTPYKYMWCEKDIMALHEHLSHIHIGRPRNDGLINSGNLPTASELRAMVRQGTVLYVKTDSGEFVPTWDAERF